MAGLVSYASSDEESADEQPQIQAPPPPKQTQPQPQPSQPAVATAPKPAARESIDNQQPSETCLLTFRTAAAPSPQPHAPRAPGASLPPPPSSALPLGPSLPPVALPSASASSSSPSPSSPYTTTRSLIHDLTLPSIPNFDIPPSPPRSRSPSSSSSSSSATTKKFEQFLSLKKTGTHLNAKLEQSSALRNPALMDKLLDFVDVLPPGRGGGGGGDGQGRQKEKALQYQTTLSAELWDPGAFPEWAFRDGLRRSSAKVAKEREMARAAGGRSSVDFVSGTMTAAAGGGGLREKRKGGWQ
ncbi:hypothetical protein NHJ13051_000032 [Beauveria bassiana]